MRQGASCNQIAERKHVMCDSLRSVPGRAFFDEPPRYRDTLCKGQLFVPMVSAIESANVIF